MKENARGWLDAMAKGEVEVTLPFAEAVRRQRAAEEAVKNPVPGQTMPDGTVFLGKYALPENLDRLGRVFNVFAAPIDLSTPLSYADTVKAVANLKGHCGFDGARYEQDEDFYQAIRDGRYKGEWVIPTSGILRNLFAQKDAGAFKGTFKMNNGSHPDYPDWYWSSLANPSTVLGGMTFILRFSDGRTNWDGEKSHHLSCRPVRLVPVP